MLTESVRSTIYECAEAVSCSLNFIAVRVVTFIATKWLSLTFTTVFVFSFTFTVKITVKKRNRAFTA